RRVPRPVEQPDRPAPGSRGRPRRARRAARHAGRERPRPDRAASPAARAAVALAGPSGRRRPDHPPRTRPRPVPRVRRPDRPRRRLPGRRPPVNLSPLDGLVRDRLGLDPAALGSAVFPGAVGRRMAVRGVADPTAYAALVAAEPGELAALLGDLVVPETWFFRGGRPLF